MKEATWSCQRGHLVPKPPSACGQTLSRHLGSRVCCYFLTHISKHPSPPTSRPPHFTGLILQWTNHLVKVLTSFSGKCLFPSCPARGKNTRVWRDGKMTGFRMRRFDSFTVFSQMQTPILTCTGLILNSSSHFYRRIIIFTWIVVSSNCKCTQEFVSYKITCSSLM